MRNVKGVRKQLETHLTLILPLISALDVLDLECPSITIVKNLKSLIGNERISVHCENMRISLPNPRDLGDKKGKG